MPVSVPVSVTNVLGPQVSTHQAERPQTRKGASKRSRCPDPFKAPDHPQSTSASLFFTTVGPGSGNPGFAEMPWLPQPAALASLSFRPPAEPWVSSLHPSAHAEPSPSWDRPLL
ncbi:hypothetical protein F2P79_007532 [Pimephales promelas]|nr:hypothetical protein F2P79_007532 [Pimephales promelas]